MSKNIIIQEGGTDYQFTAKKLKTDKVGGGSVLWVPEDETILKKKNITEEGTYKASDEGVYGYSEVTVNVTGTTQTKRITQNGTYKAEDDGLIGYSKVKVNVRGGNGSADSSGKPRTTFDSDGNVEDAPGGIGSSVVGWDEVDGNEYTVGVDSNGNLVKTKVPSGIEIGTLPTKTSYNSGETMDYSGIIVILKGGDSAIFSNTDYPNGRIPFSELVFPVNIAPTVPTVVTHTTPANNTSATYAHYGITFSFIEIGAGSVIKGNNSRREHQIISTQSKVFAVRFPETPYNYDHVLVVSPETFTVKYTDEDGPREYQTTIINAQTMRESNNWIPMQSDLQGKGQYAAEDMIRFGMGQGDGDADIPVRWVSRYDGRTFEDTFSVYITASGSGSGYSDDSGGSSSGGGGGF